jgi:hypothetical protein
MREGCKEGSKRGVWGGERCRIRSAEKVFRRTLPIPATLSPFLPPRTLSSSRSTDVAATTATAIRTAVLLAGEAAAAPPPFIVLEAGAMLMLSG